MDELINVSDLIEEYGYEDVLIFIEPSYASAFVGVSSDNRAVYDYEDMIKYLMKLDGISEGDAIDFIEYNTLRALAYYDNAPIVITRLV